jgi:uncharacterized protein YejL (UPF0352 family)
LFPQDKNKEMNELNDIVSMEFEKAMLNLIQRQGYATEKQLLDEVKLYFKGQQKYKQEQLKRCLSEIIDKYELHRITADKTLKAKLNIKTNGYPKVIMFANAI